MSWNTIKKIVIGIDFFHELTIWTLTRNHDGVFAIRLFNWSLAPAKLSACVALSSTTNAADGLPYITFVWLLTSGFIWGRFGGATIYFAQYAYAGEMAVLRENWYSWGLSIGHYYFGFRGQMFYRYNLFLLFVVWWYPLELWSYRRNLYKQVAIFLAFIIAVCCYYCDENSIVHFFLLSAFTLWTALFAGKYYKRSPVKHIDWDDNNKGTKDWGVDRLTHQGSGWFAGIISKLIPGKSTLRFENTIRELDELETIRQATHRSTIRPSSLQLTDDEIEEDTSSEITTTHGQIRRRKKTVVVDENVPTISEIENRSLFSA